MTPSHDNSSPLLPPKCYDLYCGLGGWAEGFLAERYDVTGFDIEAHDYGTGGYPGKLIIRDVRSIHGSELKDATVIVASPPCTEPSYRAMPWKKAKALNAAGPPHLFIELFNTCFRIQREASQAAGHHIPLVVENVRAAQVWIGNARWHFGSYYLWGDIPALMPIPTTRKLSGRSLNPGSGKWRPANGLGFEKSDGLKLPGQDWSNYAKTGKVSPRWRMELLKQKGEAVKGNGSWFGNYKEAKAAGRGSANRYTSSNSVARKYASALIAKIPLPLASHIAKCFKPTQNFSEGAA